MSKTLITQYYSRLDKLIQNGGSQQELPVRKEIYNLLIQFVEKFSIHRFANYKEHVIDLLKRVCRVSGETMGIVGEMEK